MKWLTNRKVLLTMVVAACLALVVVLVPLSGRSTGAKRGDYPRCQDACLFTLQKSMADASDELGRTGDRRRYEEKVSRGPSRYRSCLEDCREAIPVK